MFILCACVQRAHRLADERTGQMWGYGDRGNDRQFKDNAAKWI